eukprot:6814151-Lingulodinium_polyedra.AAC.1
MCIRDRPWAPDGGPASGPGRGTRRYARRCGGHGPGYARRCRGRRGQGRLAGTVRCPGEAAGGLCEECPGAAAGWPCHA